MVKTISLAILIAVAALGGFASIAGSMTIATYAQEAPTPSNANTLTGLITASTALIAGISGIIIAFLTFIKSKTGDNKIINDVIYWANNAKETDKWVLENQEKLQTVVSVVENLSPEAKKKLADGSVGMQEMTTDLNAAKEEIDRIYDIVPRAPEGKPVVSTKEAENK